MYTHPNSTASSRSKRRRQQLGDIRAVASLQLDGRTKHVAGWARPDGPYGAVIIGATAGPLWAGGPVIVRWLSSDVPGHARMAESALQGCDTTGSQSVRRPR